MIETIEYKLNEDDAVKLFKRQLRRFKRGKFLFPTSFFIPYYLFQVEVLHGGKLTSQLLAVDAMGGELDLYRFEQLPTELINVETTQFGAVALSEKQSWGVLKEKVRRAVYLQGFFQIRDLLITGKAQQLIYLPYWVGFFQQKNQAEIEVIDALRGSFEGAKVCDLIYDWFAHEAEKRRQKT